MSRSYAFAPRLMQAQAAAYYVGVSVSKFGTLNIPARKHGGNTLYDIRDLDAWVDNLSYGEERCADQLLADEAFGIAAE